ncbi:hypothetical protein [Methylomonas rhizoryzae]|nr:hypothetical protein [Methylomonas rhizoryzae]
MKIQAAFHFQSIRVKVLFLVDKRAALALQVGNFDRIDLIKVCR